MWVIVKIWAPTRERCEQIARESKSRFVGVMQEGPERIQMENIDRELLKHNVQFLGDDMVLVDGVYVTFIHNLKGKK